MIDNAWRFLKRFAVLLPGIGIAYLSIRDIFPAFDKRLPLGLAVLITYVIAAYILIPAALRVVRIFFSPRHLPLYSVTPDGFASDPLNVGIIGTREQLIKAMKASGWYEADEKAPHNILRQALSILLDREYLTAPMSNLYLFGRKQDIGFEIPIEGGRGHRHHVRFWATRFEDNNPLSAKSIHWYERKSKHGGGRLLWLGAASKDIGLAFIRHNVQITHMIHPDTTQERMLIIDGLQRTGLVENVQNITLREPYALRNRAIGGHLRTDGVLRVATLAGKPGRRKHSS
jgi:hypothetical protein